MSEGKEGGNFYILDSLSEIVGNMAAMAKLRSFAQDVEKGTKRTPLLVYGPCGVGKSMAAHLLAKEYGWNVAELNASDYRDKESIDRKLLSAATSRSIFGKRNLVLLDEIDELVAGLDKGASAAINNLLESAKNPVILIANDMWDRNISFLRGKTEPVEFRRLASDEVRKAIDNLCRKMSMGVNVENMDIIAARSNGDVRSAINDLTVATGYGSDITEVIGMRDRKVDIFNTLDKIFFSNTLSAPLKAMANSDLTNDMLIRWIEENIPNRYESMVELYSAFSSLSDASAYSTKAMRAQYYVYWRYMNVLMSSGVALSKVHYPTTFKRYAFPRIIKDLSSTKTTRRYDIEIAKRLQGVVHASAKRIARNELTMLEVMIGNSVKAGETKDSMVESLSRLYGIDDELAGQLIKKAG